MTEPNQQPTGEQPTGEQPAGEAPTGDAPAAAPTVSTAPPTRRRIPSHIGPARLSTVVLAVLWLALGTLYLNVRPPSPETAASTGTSVETTEPGRATTAPAATTPAPTTATATGTTPPTSAPTETPTEPTTTLPGTTDSTVPAQTTAPSTPLPTPNPTIAPTS